MIDPKNVTNFNRSDEDLEEFALFSVCVANKDADVIASKVHAMLSGRNDGETPFDFLRRMGSSLLPTLVEHKLSPYSQRLVALNGMLGQNLRMCTKDDLLGVPYIGPKTARFFLLNSRPDMDLAVLDGHMMRLLRWHGITKLKQAPTQEKQYAQLEGEYRKFRQRCCPDITPAEFDLIVWRSMSGRDSLVPGWLIPRKI